MCSLHSQGKRTCTGSDQIQTAYITIKKSVYDELKRFKKENESFSELLDRLVKSQSKKDLIRSLRGSIEFEDKNDLLADLKKKRWEKGN